MAKKNVKVAKKGKPAKTVAAATPEGEKKKKGSPVVIFLPRKLKGMAKLAAMANGVSLAAVVREHLEAWVPQQQKAIAKLVSDTSNVEEDDDDEATEEADDDEDAEESEDEDEDDDEEEDDDEDEE